MTQAIVGRSKKPAKRQNYKISYSLLAGLKGVAALEDRSDTAQLERWIREGIDRWRLGNSSKVKELDTLISNFLASEGVESETESDHTKSQAPATDEQSDRAESGTTTTEEATLQEQTYQAYDWEVYYRDGTAQPITTKEEVPPLGAETNATEGEHPLSEQVEAEQPAPEPEQL